MGLGWTVGGFFVGGWALSLAVGGAAAPARGRLEQCAWAGLWGLACWLGASWALALTGQLARVPLAAAGLLAGAAGLAGLRVLQARARAARPAASSPVSPAPVALPPGRGGALLVAALLVAVLAGWGLFVLWRAAHTPVVGNNSLSYHLPRAALLVREGGYATFASPDHRVANWPANYELLLAGLLLLEGHDRHLAALSLLCFLLYLAAAGAVGARWGGGGDLGAAGTVALSAAAPVALLHSGAMKNDLLVAFLSLAAFLALGDWVARRGRGALLGGATALALALGTKVNAALLLPALLPPALVALRRRPPQRPSPGALVRGAAFLALAGLLGGGAVYALNLAETGRPVGVPAVAQGAWGDWGNLWMLPTLLFSAPFSASPYAVWAPWSGRPWMWGRYDVYSSHLGVLVSLLLPLVPLGLWRLRGGGPGGPERVHGSAAALLAFLLLLPTRLVPVGYFATFARFLLFAVPVVGAWTLAPALGALAAGGPARRRLAAAVALGVVGVLAFTAVQVARHDVELPLARVLECAEGGACAGRFSRNRACVALNQVAGPQDPVAVDADFEAALYPCFGPFPFRRVHLLDVRAGGGAVAVPEDARWVVVDRSSRITWGHPGFTDFGRFFELAGKGEPGPDDTHLFRQLSADPRFRLVFHARQSNQAIFQRLPAGGAPPARREGR
jgi:hypothetical protein